MMSEYRCVSLRAISSYSSGSLKTSQIEIIRTGQNPQHHCTVHALCVVCCVLCVVHCVLCAVCCVLCVVHCVLCAVPSSRGGTVSHTEPSNKIFNTTTAHLRETRTMAMQLLFVTTSFLMNWTMQLKPQQVPMPIVQLHTSLLERNLSVHPINHGKWTGNNAVKWC